MVAMYTWWTRPSCRARMISEATCSVSTEYCAPGFEQSTDGWPAAQPSFVASRRRCTAKNGWPSNSLVAAARAQLRIAGARRKARQ